MKPAEPTVRHVIIVAQVKNQVVGLLVDAVSDILTDLPIDEIQPTPDVISSEFERSFARGVLAIEGRHDLPDRTRTRSSRSEEREAA